MGANDKHEATYHGGTPSPKDLRDKYSDRRGPLGNETRDEGAARRFDRAINKIKASAWEEGVEYLYYSGDKPTDVIDEIKTRNPYKDQP